MIWAMERLLLEVVAQALCLDHHHAHRQIRRTDAAHLGGAGHRRRASRRVRRLRRAGVAGAWFAHVGLPGAGLVAQRSSESTLFGISVRLRQHRDAGLLQHLGARQRGGLRGEVRVHDPAAGGRLVLGGDLQGGDHVLETVLGRTERRARGVDLRDREVDRSIAPSAPVPAVPAE
jgi:hypothetical protein